MRRNRSIVLALAALVAAYAAAQTSPSSAHHSKTHHAAVHHPRSHHPAPPANPEAKEHQRIMKEEAGSRRRNSLTSTEGRSSLKAERNANSAQRAESAREARARRKQAVKPRSIKKHPTATHTVGENRLERERRAAAESGSRYEEGFRAGFAAGLAARRTEAESAYAAPTASHPDSRALASRSAGPAPAAETHISDATVRSTTPMTADGGTAGDVATPAHGMERSHSRPEKASLEGAAGEHVAPLSLSASMHLLHEPVPAPLRGTLASLQRQNQRLDAEGLQRIEDQSDLEYRIASKLLVPLPVSGGLAVNPELPAQRRYCRRWTAEFLTDLAHMHEAVFHRPLRVDSAVRTVDYQRRLIRVNSNAAPAEGDVASPHETGAAVDIAKRGMTWREIGWMRRYLMTLQNAGLIDVEEEFYQSCFHVTVYDTYARHGASRQAGTGSGEGTDRTSDTADGASGAQGQ